MPKIADFRHVCRGPQETLAGWRIRLYRLVSGMTVVVATELPGNAPPASINMIADALATEIRRLYVVPGGAMVWIEHCPGKQETFHRVLFQWDGKQYAEPERKPSSRSQVETLIGEALEDREG